MRLPDSVQQIADVIGREQALLLVGKLPRCIAGKDGHKSSRVVMYVPTLARLALDHKLVQILGWIDAEKLSRHFGGEIMYPANCAHIQREFLHKTIIQMMAGGRMKATECAAIVGVHERTVRNLIRENPPEETEHASNDNRVYAIKKASNMTRKTECAA